MRCTSPVLCILNFLPESKGASRFCDRPRALVQVSAPYSLHLYSSMEEKSAETL